MDDMHSKKHDASVNIRITGVMVGCESGYNVIDMFDIWVAFAFNHGIAVYCNRDGRVVSLLSVSHRIRFLKFIHCLCNNECLYIAVGLNSGEIKFIVSFLGESPPTFKIVGTQKVDDCAPNNIEAVLTKNGHFLSVISHGINISLLFAKNHTAASKTHNSFLQNLKTSKTIALTTEIFSADLALWSDSILFVVCAGVDGKIYIFSAEINANFDKTELELASILPSHDDWIREVSFSGRGETLETSSDSGKLTFASASQDGKIIVWEISPVPLEKSSLGYFRIAKTVFRANGVEFCVHRRGVLRGHSDGVSSVAWPCPGRFASPGPRPSLLSASLDGSVRLWADFAESAHKAQSQAAQSGGGSEWDEVQTVCKSRAKGGGVTRAVWSGGAVLASCRNGAVLKWGFCERKEAFSEEASITGHVGKVTAVRWNKDLNVLFTAGWDKTVRVWKRVCGDSGTRRWAEIGRPQSHGYKIENLCFLKSDPLSFLSFSQEEAIRIFTATKTFTAHFPSLPDSADNRADRATYSELNLCNAPVFSDSPPAAHFLSPVDNVFTESYLAAETLWQEVHKLYVRRNKITAVALSERSLAVASESCTTSKKCEIEFWAVGPKNRDWEKCDGSVVCHSLAVTEMAFSADSNVLVSASRDKSVGVFGVARDGTPQKFKKIKLIKNAHSRSINCCLWMGVSKFLTGSSDKKIKMWAVDINNSDPAKSSVSLLATYKLAFGVNCMSFHTGFDAVGVGLADGNVSLIEMEENRGFGCANSLVKMTCGVTSLDWNQGQDYLFLAVSDDNGVVKIIEFEQKERKI